MRISARNDQYYNQAPVDFETQGSHDGAAFTTIAAFNGIAWGQQGETRYFSFENDTAYLYYRLSISKSASNAISISQLHFGHYEKLARRVLEKCEHVIPIMGGYGKTTEEGTYKVTCESEYSANRVYNLFDRTYSSRYETKDGALTGWIQIELPIPKIANVLRIASRNDSWAVATPRNYILKGSNDGATWTDLFSITNSQTFSRSELRTHEIKNSAAYKFYRLVVSNPGTTTLTFSVWELIYRYAITDY